MKIKDILSKDLITGEQTRSLKLTPLQQSVVKQDVLASNSLVKSPRGAIILALTIYVFIEFVSIVSKSFLMSWSTLESAIYVPLIFFIYKRKKWAIVATMIVMTLGRGYSALQGNNPIMQIIVWVIIMSILYRAYLVEKVIQK